MKERQLPDPPRTLARELSRNLWWGTPATVFATGNLFLVLLATLFMFLIYGIPLRALFPFAVDHVRVTSHIVRKEMETLPSGGEAMSVVAPVKVNEVVIEARGYGEAAESSKEGDPVEILVPKSRPADASLVGYDPYPVRPGTLVLLGVLFTFPGFLVAGMAALAAVKKRDLLISGQEIRGDQLRKIPLPRPVKDMVLVRWEYSHDGRTSHFWTMQKAELEKPCLLVSGNRAAVLPNILPHYSTEGGELVSLSKVDKVCAGLNRLFLALSLVTLAAFLLL